MNTAARRLDATRSTLVLVDYQARLMPAIDGHRQVLAEATRVAEAASMLGVASVGTEQNPAGLGPTVEPLRSLCTSTLAKMHFGACEAGLADLLGAPHERPEVVIAGCETHVCLLQTALGLLRLGRDVAVVAQACGSRSAVDRDLGLQRLRDAGALIVSTEMVLFEWLHTCKHPRFKEVQTLIKSPA